MAGRAPTRTHPFGTVTFRLGVSSQRCPNFYCEFIWGPLFTSYVWVLAKCVFFCSFSYQLPVSYWFIRNLHGSHALVWTTSCKCHCPFLCLLICWLLCFSLSTDFLQVKSHDWVCLFVVPGFCFIFTSVSIKCPTQISSHMLCLFNIFLITLNFFCHFIENRFSLTWFILIVLSFHSSQCLPTSLPLQIHCFSVSL